MLVSYSDGIIVIGPSKKEVTTTQNIGKIIIGQMERSKSDQKSGFCHLREISRVPVVWDMSIQLFQRTDYCIWLFLSHRCFTIRWATLNFGGNNYLICVCYPDPFSEQPEKLLVLGRVLHQVWAPTQIVLHLRCIPQKICWCWKQITTLPRLSVMNWVLSDQQSCKIEYVLQHFITKWKQSPDRFGQVLKT